MGNCLVTKLKENVNNDNLEILGEAIFTVATKNSGSSTLVVNQKNQNTKVYSNGSLVATLTDNESSLVIPANSVYEVHLLNKYKFGYIGVSGYSNWNYITINWDELALSEPDTSFSSVGLWVSDKSYQSSGHLTSIEAFLSAFYPNNLSFILNTSDIIEGDLSELNKPLEWVELKLEGNQSITGSITDLSEFTNLNALSIRTANINVSHTKDFFDALHLNGKRGTLELRFLEKEVAETDVEGLIAGLNTIVFNESGWTVQ